MWELDSKESWTPKNWCFWTVVLEKTLKSPLDYKEIQPVHSKGNRSWIFIGGTDAEAETPILWLPDVKKWLLGKDPDAGKDWRQEEKGVTEGEMVEWHHRLDRNEFEQAPVVGDGQGGLVCCSPWVTKCWTQLSDWTDSTVVCIPLYIKYTTYAFLFCVFMGVLCPELLWHFNLHSTYLYLIHLSGLFLCLSRQSYHIIIFWRLNNILLIYFV